MYYKDDNERAPWRLMLGDNGLGCLTVCLRRVERYIPAHWVIDGYSMYDPDIADNLDAPVVPWTDWSLKGDPHYEAYDPQPLNGPDGKQIVTPDPRVLAAQFLCHSIGDLKCESLRTALESVLSNTISGQPTTK